MRIGIYPATAAPAPRPQPAPEAPRTAYAGGRASTSLASPAYGAERASTEAPAAPGAERTGWISDLLRRVSDDDDRAPARAAAPAEVAPKAASAFDSLSSLTVDIARAIDNDAFADLWKRYRRGEPRVFTRRLYTLQGQQTFDEIRRKYQRDGEFRTAVDRYLDHFSALYDEAMQKDPNGATAQSYLNSDTGKVYTMLAHASGKLG